MVSVRGATAPVDGMQPPQSVQWLGGKSGCEWLPQRELGGCKLQTRALVLLHSKRCIRKCVVGGWVGSKTLDNLTLVRTPYKVEFFSNETTES